MRFSRIYVLCILVFLALVFVMELRMPRRFDWNPTFSTESTQPFGCQLFDSVLAASLPNGYEVNSKTLYQLSLDSTGSPRSVLAVDYDYEVTVDGETDMEAMFKMAERGDKVMIATNNHEKTLDTLGVYLLNIVSGNVKPFGILDMEYKRDTMLTWTGDTARFNRRDYMIYPQLSRYCFCIDTDSDAVKREHNVLAISRKSENWCSAIEFPIGKGAIYLVPVPLLFTNYGVIDDECRHFLMRLLTQLADRPLVRTTAYLPRSGKSEDSSPLRYFLAHPPLRWALYLTMLTIIVFMAFTARRRQRAIPVVKEPENKSMEFVGLIASLYEQRRDYRDLVLKKFTYFAEELRRELHIDLSNPADDANSVSRLAEATKIDAHELEALVANLRHLQQDEAQITKKTMTNYIKQMNHIKNQLQ